MSLLLVSLNEKNLKYNESNCNDLLEYIGIKKPDILIICTQNSLSGTDKHFQHQISDRLHKEIQYKILHKTVNPKKKILSVLRYVFTKQNPALINDSKMNLSKKNEDKGLRVRIYISPLFESEIEIVEQIITKDYILLRININGKIYCIINKNNINTSNLDIGYYDYIYICGLTESKINLNQTNFTSKSESNINKNKLKNNLNKSINKFTEFIDKLIKIKINVNKQTSTVMNNNKISRNSKQSLKENTMNLSKRSRENTKLVQIVPSSGGFLKFNKKNNSTCVSSINANKLGNIISEATNLPNNQTYVPYYVLMKQMFLSGNTIELFICLFDGVYTDKSFKKAQEYNNIKIKENFENRITFLKKFLEYLYLYKSREPSSKENISITNKLVNNLQIAQLDKLISIIENVRDKLLKSYMQTFIITNNIKNNVEYQDFYIKNNDQYLYYLTLLSNI